MIRFAGTSAAVMPSAKAWMAFCMSVAFFGQFAVVSPPGIQQLWNSSRKRATKREFAGISRLIFAFAAAYASALSLLAKNGDCAVAAVDEWQRTQLPLFESCRIGYTVASNAADDSGKVLLLPT